MPDVISADLKNLLRHLKLSPMLHTLPERIDLAKKDDTPYHEFLETIFSDEVERRSRLSTQLRARRAKLDLGMRLETWDSSAKITYDRKLWSELVSMRFVESHNNVVILGPVGVGKTHLASTLGHIGCRRGMHVLMGRTERLLKELKAARLDNTYDRELRRLVSVDILILDDFALDAMDPTESRDIYEVILDRHQQRSTVITSNRSPDEWLSVMADPLRAQSAIDRLINSAYELVVEGESYRSNQKPKLEGGTS